MRVWIDLDNSPHVLFFAPIIRKLEQQGADLTVTVRCFSQTEELARAHGLKFTIIGEHKTPHQFVRRATATVRRAVQLASHVRHAHPDVAISHGSRAMVLAAWILGVPSMTLYDYEFVSSRVFNQISDRILAPSVVDVATLRRNGLALRKFTPYPGLKEEVYVYDFQPDPAVLHELGLDPNRVIITVRPFAEWAHYHGESSETLFRALVERVRHIDGVQVVILPRTPDQKERLISNYGLGVKPFQIAEHAVDGLSLLWYSDAVFSGGGTMVREAALLGANVYSIFGGKPGSADQTLIAAGRLKLIRTPQEIDDLQFSKSIKPRHNVNGDRTTRDFIYRQIYDFARSRSSRKNAKVA